MARNRQRASERKRRNLDGSVDGVAPDAVDRDPNPIHRSGVPGEVEHTGEVDQFEAALVAGADGEPETDLDAVERAALDASGDDGVSDGGDAGGRDLVAAGNGGRDGGGGGGAVALRDEAGADRPAPAAGGNRITTFLRASAAELRRVQWPDRRHVGQATAVVLGFVVVAGAFLGLADVVAEQIVDLLI
jgi:preprotein translocase SecE subunit